jgi:superkiller protein 3
LPSPPSVANLLSERRYTEAINHLENEAARRPADPEPLLQLGQIYLQQRRWLLAEDAFNRALALDSEQALAYAGLGEVHLRQGNMTAALRSWQSAIKQNPNLPGVFTGLGRSELALLNFDAAKEAFEKQQAQRSDPEAQWYLAAFEAPLDIATANDYLLAIPPDAPADILARRDYLLATLVPFTDKSSSAEIAQATGIALAQAELWPLAIHALQQAGTEAGDPAFRARTLAFLGHSRAQSGQPALDLFEQARELDPNSALPLYFYGIYLRQQGALTAATRLFEQALALDPDNAAIHVELARTQTERGDYAAAEAEYDAAVTAANNTPEIQLLQVLFYAQRGYRIAEKGIPAGEALVEADKTNAEAYNWLGWMYLLDGKADKAEETLRRALDLDPQLVSARFHLARLLLLDGKASAAAAEYRRVVDEDLTGTLRDQALQVLQEIEAPQGSIPDEK